MVAERAAGLNSPNPENNRFTGLGLAESSLPDIRLGFRAGFVIEVRNRRSIANPVVAVHSFALNPQRYTLTEPYQNTLTPTEDNSVVSEENGPIIREVQIEGTFAMNRKRGPSFKGDQGTRTGNEHFIHLRNLFREYGRLKQTPQASDYRMVFHALRDDDHFVVVPRSFETARDARSTRLHYPYRITLAVIGEETFDGFGLGISEFLRNLSQAFHDARSFFARASNELEDMRRRVADVETVLLQAGDLINAVGEVLDGTANLINYPLELAVNVVSDLAVAADRLAVSTTQLTPGSIQEEGSRNLRRLEAAIDRLLSIPERFGPSPTQDTLDQFDGERNLSEDDLDNGTAGADLGSRTRLALGSSQNSGAGDASYQGVLRERVDATTTIRSLGIEFDISEALIILINRLKYPYITTDGGPGILKPGDTILIPVVGGVVDDQTPPNNGFLTPEEALYGIDMALDQTLIDQQGQFDLRIDNTLTDVDLRRGIDNVIQGTEITIRTERGATSYVPEVGIRRSIGLKGTIQHVLLTALNLREGILTDPRVEGIDDSRVVLEDDVLIQEITPRLRGDRIGPTLQLPFGSVTGE